RGIVFERIFLQSTIFCLVFFEIALPQRNLFQFRLELLFELQKSGQVFASRGLLLSWLSWLTTVCAPYEPWITAANTDDLSAGPLLSDLGRVRRTGIEFLLTSGYGNQYC